MTSSQNDSDRSATTARTASSRTEAAVRDETQATPARIAAWMAHDDGGEPGWPRDEPFVAVNSPPEDPAEELPAMTAPDGGPGREVIAAGFTHRLRGFAAGGRVRGRRGAGHAGSGAGAGGFHRGRRRGRGDPARRAVPARAAVPAGPRSRPGQRARVRCRMMSWSGVICAWRRLVSWAAAGEAAAVAELGRRRAAQSRELRSRHLVEHLGDELAAALTLTGQAAAAWSSWAPSWTGCAPAGPRWPPGSSTGPGRSCSLTSSPSSTMTRPPRRWRRGCRQDARAEVWEEPSGNAALAGRDLPPAQILAAD